MPVRWLRAEEFYALERSVLVLQVRSPRAQELARQDADMRAYVTARLARLQSVNARQDAPPPGVRNGPPVDLATRPPITTSARPARLSARRSGRQPTSRLARGQDRPARLSARHSGRALWFGCAEGGVLPPVQGRSGRYVDRRLLPPRLPMFER